MLFTTRSGPLTGLGFSLVRRRGLGLVLALGLGLGLGSGIGLAAGAAQGAGGPPTASTRHPAAKAPSATTTKPTAAQIDEARGLAKRFSERLQGALQSALAEGGPEMAIGVCREEAPSIAGELSREGDWAVGRTALRVRNPRNAPSVRERAVLMRFLRRAEAGEDLAGMEHAAIVGEGDDRLLHYMKAIPTGGLCLTCHGKSLAPGLKDAIRASYPADAATGFEQGELRGAFTFVRPLGIQTGKESR